LVLILLPQEQKKREDFERKWVESKGNDKGAAGEGEKHKDWHNFQKKNKK
jgi:hypothetical protein